jgi:DNA-directed RNA polymerase subunit D
MDLEVEDETEDVLKLKLSDSNEAVANGLRRAMITHVETLATDHIEVMKNESSLFDEMLAHRVGQIPFTIPQNVEGEDTVHLAVKQEGPGKVHASDIKTDNDEAEPVNPETVIATLKEGQEVEVEGEAQLGKGFEHAKHHGGTVGYEKTGEGEFLFRIESTSGYSNEELFNAALEELETQLDEFKEAVADL